MLTNKFHVRLLFFLSIAGFVATSSSSGGQLITSLQPDPLTRSLINSYRWGSNNPAKLIASGAAAYAGWKVLKRPVFKLLDKIESLFPTTYQVARGLTGLTGASALAYFVSYHWALHTDPQIQATFQSTLLPFAFYVFSAFFPSVNPFGKIIPGMGENSEKKEKDEKAKESLEYIPAPSKRIDKEEAILMYGKTMEDLIKKLYIDRKKDIKDQQGVQFLAYGAPGTGKTYLGEILQEVTGYPMLFLDATKNESPIALDKYVGGVETGFRALKDRVRYFHEQEGNNLIVLLDETDPHLRQMNKAQTDENKKHGDSENKNLNGFLKECRKLGIIVICTSNLSRDEANGACLRRFTFDDYRKSDGPGDAIEIKIPTDEARISMVDEQLRRKLTSDYKNAVIVNKPDFTVYVAGQLKGLRACDVATTISNIFSSLKSLLDQPEKWMATAEHPSKPTIEPTLFIDITDPACKRIIDQVLASVGADKNQSPQQAFGLWATRIGGVIGPKVDGLSNEKKIIKIAQLQEFLEPLKNFLHPFDGEYPYNSRLKRIKKQLNHLMSKPDDSKKQNKLKVNNNDEIERLKKEKKQIEDEQKRHIKKFNDLEGIYQDLTNLTSTTFAEFAKKYKINEKQADSWENEDAAYIRTAYALTQLKDAQKSREQFIEKLSPDQLLEKAKKHASTFTEGNNINQGSLEKNKKRLFPLYTQFTPFYSYDKYSRSNIKQTCKEIPSPDNIVNYNTWTFLQQAFEKLFLQRYTQVEITGKQELNEVSYPRYFPLFSTLKPQQAELYQILGLNHSEIQEGILGDVANSCTRLLTTYNPFYRLYSWYTKSPGLNKQTTFQFISTELVPFYTSREDRIKKTNSLVSELSKSNYTKAIVDQKIAETILELLKQPTDNIKVSRSEKGELMINGETTIQLRDKLAKNQAMKLLSQNLH